MTKKKRSKRSSFGFDPVPSKSIDEWDRPPLLELDIPPGNFRAWIAATDHPEHEGALGPSVCAWQLWREGDPSPLPPEIWPGRRVESDESKAYVAAVAGVLDRLPVNSKVEIFCSAEWIVEALNGNADMWDLNGELDSGTRSYAEIWKHILKRRAEISSDPKSVRGDKPDKEGKAIITKLKKAAKRKCL